MTWLRTLAGFLVFGGILAGGPAPGREAPARLPINEPVPVTSEADPVVDAAVSRDGRWLVVSSRRERFSDLWLRSADPSRVEVPRRLTFDPADESAPALSADGRWLAYVGTGDDVKGDVYLLDLRTKGAVPRRLTGPGTAEGAPSFSADGSVLFLQQEAGGTTRLVSLDLQQRSPEPRALGIEGSQPAASPDGTRLAFVSRATDPGGDLAVLDLRTGAVSRATSGSAIDAFPAWSEDGRFLYFTRFGLDTDRDGAVTARDAGVLWRVPASGPEERAFPVTAFDHSSFRPQLAGARLYALSPRGGVANVWALPPDGEVPTLSDAARQADLADGLARRVPRVPALAALASLRVAEAFPRDPVAARALVRAGTLYRSAGLRPAAARAFEAVGREWPGAVPEAALAALALVRLRADEALETSVSPGDRRRLVEEATAAAGRVAGAYPSAPTVQARASIEQARLLLDYGGDATTLGQALELLDAVVRDHAAERPEAAEASVRRADGYARLAGPAEVHAAYLAALDAFPDQEEWADRAVEQILDLGPASAGPTPLEAKVLRLREVAEESRTSRPRLAMGALNRVGDLFFGADEWARAKAAYREVLQDFPVVATRTAAARLALAEILYREERYREAIDLYETEIGQRPEEDPIYRLARAGYIRRSAEAGDSLFRGGEVSAARKVFRELMDYDDAVVEAHRGYIQCAAAQGDLPPVLSGYRARLKRAPADAIAAYATGLCLTYLETRSAAREAKELLERAISLQGQVEYFHQTYGYVCEVLETVYGDKGTLPLAAEAYQKASFLNDPLANPSNAANLTLNLGNAYHLLGQHRQAFDCYTRRLEAKAPFLSDEAEILFYRRLGASAFQIREPEASVRAFEKALERVAASRDPRRASEALDASARYVLERVVEPAGRDPARAQPARSLAQDQSALNGRLAALTQRAVDPPPSPGWTAYRQGIEALLAEQVALNRRAADVAGTAEAREAMARLASRVPAALGRPERLALLEAELWDRLALSRQEAGDAAGAAEAFERAYTQNERLGLTANLARVRRSVAYSLYQQVPGAGAGQRAPLLLRSAEGFRQALDLLQRYGVPARTEGAGEGLLSFKVEQALDAAGATRAATGFSAEQEKRLCETFLARIRLELGEVAAAEAALAPQIAEVPDGTAVADADVHGVSLLFHRAGHIAAARGDVLEAFARFRRSAALSVRSRNAVAACTSTANLASLAAGLPSGAPTLPRLVSELRAADRDAGRLLALDPSASSGSSAASYHNAMGVHWARLGADSDAPGEGVEAAALRVAALRDAAVHLTLGLRALAVAGEPARRSREELAAEAVLHLNLAEVLGRLADGTGAQESLALALEAARRGLRPDLEWRALASLGRRQEALGALEAASILHAGAGSEEIEPAFGPLVADLVRQGRAEDAFNLAERVGELDRAQRLAPLTIGRLSTDERRLCRDLAPRLVRVRDLRRRVAVARGEERQYLQSELERELSLFRGQLGDGSSLPAVARLLGPGDEDARELVLALLGAALLAEERADAAVVAGEGPEAAALRTEAKAWQQRYAALLGEGLAAAQASLLPVPTGVVGLFGAAPAEAIDAMESLPEGEALVRLIPADVSGSSWVAITVTPDAITASFAASPSEVALPPAETLVLAGEGWSRRAPVPGAVRALTATHFVRAVRARKPFKSALLAVPGPTPEVPGYRSVTLPAPAGEPELLAALAGVQTLLLRGRVSLLATVPTRPGERPVRRVIAEAGLSAGVPVAAVASRGESLSLALLPDVSPAAVYPAAQLLALFGCPTVVLGGSAGLDAGAVGSLLAAFADGFLRATGVARGAQVLGFGGLAPAEAAALARQRFEATVRAAQQALGAGGAGGPRRALTWLEEAVAAAGEVEVLNRYLPDLHRLAREAAFRAGETEEAARHAAALVELLAASQPDTAAHAEALLRLGLLEARLERFDRSTAHLDEAREMLANLDLGPEEAAALADLGTVFESATEYDRALVEFSSAAQLSRTLGKDDLLARQHESLGRVYDLRLSRYARARKEYEAALTVHRTLGDPAGQARALLDAGRCLRLLGNFPEAEARYREALALTEPGAGAPREAGDGLVRLRAKALLEQANSAWFQARYQEAFDLVQRVLALAREHGWVPEQVMARNTSGLLWWTLGDPDKALRELGEALDQAQTLEGRPDEVATTLNNLGLVYREAGRYPEATAALERALAIDRRLKSRWAIAYDLRNQGLTLLRMGRAAEGLPLLEEAASEAAAIGDRVNSAKALLALGEARQELGQAASAEGAYREALELARSIAGRETEWRSLFGLARLALAAENSGEAGRLLDEAVRVIEATRAALKIDQLKDGFLTDKMAVYEALVKLRADAGDSVGAFEVAERSRSRGFIDLLGNQRLNLAGAVDRELYSRQRSLAAHIEETEALVAQAGSDAERATYATALTRLRDERRDLLLEIQSKNPALASLVSVDPMTADQVRALLPPDVALLVYYVLPEELLCWVLRSDGVRLVRMPGDRKVLGASLLEYRRVIQNLEPAEERSRELFSQLVVPLMSNLEGVRTLGIVPHGVLHYLSFATLSDGHDTLIDRMPLFYLPSASVLRYTLQRRRAERNTRVLAIGNPDLGDPFLDLPFAEQEVGAIRWSFPEITLLTRERATESWVRQHIGEFGIIHLASHGEFDPVNPLFSAVKLARDQEQDGDLRASEVFSLNLQADLVVLSACQTGLGRVTQGDDVIGLNRAFLYAGTHTIASSLWRVSDLSTALLAKRFYRLYGARNKAEALRGAMLHVKNRFPHPGYWGAFVLTGDYE
ncbi:MAG: CHAT domain-containing protein [Deltaproteobacteria bacterium]|nr:CHAT domain-containing protein [Deltaproteobacteria bacterium]